MIVGARKYEYQMNSAQADYIVSLTRKNKHDPMNKASKQKILCDYVNTQCGLLYEVDKVIIY